MATFEITEGAPGQGKSLYTARLTSRLLARNEKWHETSGLLRRRVAINLKLSEDLEHRYGVCTGKDDFSGYILYWTDTSTLCELRDVDIVWDEIATELDSRNWPSLSVEMKRFLSQYRKRGVDIYANTQDFSMIDQRARLMITGVRTLTKLIGSADISSTKPPPKYLWGIIIIRDVENYREADPEKKKYSLLFEIMLIQRYLVEMYDTRQDIKLGAPPPLKHEVRYCELHGKECDFVKVSHS